MKNFEAKSFEGDKKFKKSERKTSGRREKIQKI
jgi:hypothetical protein